MKVRTLTLARATPIGCPLISSIDHSHNSVATDLLRVSEKTDIAVIGEIARAIHPSRGSRRSILLLLQQGIYQGICIQFLHVRKKTQLNGTDSCAKLDVSIRSHPSYISGSIRTAAILYFCSD
jgi:hypothetical protein